MPMARIDKNKFPLLHRLLGAFYPGIPLSPRPEESWSSFLIDFFRDDELVDLYAELQKISSMNMTDREWESFWFQSPATTFPKTAEFSHLVLEILMKTILKRRGAS
jgi:hypothetical protein